MAHFRGNIDHWLRQAEPDYYILFLKAWIPFNAWYVAELPHFDKKDADIIKELQDNENSKPRHIIENYLIGPKTQVSDSFKNHLGQLHHYLETKTIIHNRNRITFRNINLTENPDKFKKHVDSSSNVYKAERTQSYYQAFIETKGGKTLLDFKHPSYNLDDLQKNVDFIRINDTTIQQHILDCYIAINPKKPIDLVQDSSSSHFILLGNENPVQFKKEPTSIARATIKILYALRCMLFHGEIEPTPVNYPVYEHAYNLLRLIIKELQ